MEFWRLDEEWDDPAANAAACRRRPRRRTAAWLALAFILGVFVGLVVPVSIPLALALAAAIAILSLVTYAHAWTTPLLYLALTLLGAADARLTVFPAGPAALSRLLVRQSEYVRFRLLATEDAVLRPPGISRREAYIFTGRLQQLDRTGRWLPCDEPVRVVLQSPREHHLPAPRYGDTWEMRGILEPAHLVRCGFFRLPRNEAIVDADRATRLATGGGNPFLRWCAERRRACRRVLSRGVEDQQPGAAMVQALLLGYRQDIPEPLREDFSATGTIHIFAISGAHVGIICSFLLVLMKICCIPIHRRLWFLVPILAIYVVMTGASASAVRAAIMLGCLHAAPAIRRRPDAPSALALAAFFILLVSPGDLANMGFILSFAAVGGILALQPIFARLAARLLPGDPWRARPPRSDRDDARPLWAFPVDSFVLGLSVWVATAPLTLYFFNLVSPVAPLLNLLVIPAAYFILLGGVLALLASVIHPVLALPFVQSSTTLANLLARVVRWASDLPGGHFYAPSSSLFFLVLWAAILLLGCLFFRRRPRLTAASTFLALALLAAAFFFRHGTENRLYVLDATPGQALLYRHGRHVTLIDTGPAFRAPVVLRQLRAIGVNHLDALVLSHIDTEHIGAVPAILDAFPVRAVFLPARVWNCTATARWLELFAARPDLPPLVRYAAGDRLPMPPGTTAEVLWPPADIHLSASDDAALLLRLTSHGRSVLACTDFGGALERHYLDLSLSNPDLFPPPRADTILLGRGSAADASSIPWLKAVAPSLAIGTQSASIKARTPAPEVLDRLSALHLPLLLPVPRTPLPLDF
ncbi:MAG: ComEC/Rec2 family competence protein [Kiritimatiellae bacterium]|nr:ComEC/Rec2 family competence protein [Kiritimatiellia bacterium]